MPHAPARLALLGLALAVGASACVESVDAPRAAQRPSSTADVDIVQCDWTDIGTVFVEGTVTNTGSTTDTYRMDFAYLIDGDTVAVGRGSAIDVQPGETAGFTGVIDHPEPGGTCRLLRVQ